MRSPHMYASIDHGQTCLSCVTGDRNDCHGVGSYTITICLWLVVAFMPSPSQTVSHKHVLYSEVLSVTSAMCKNSRWVSSAHFLNSRDSALASNLGLRISSPSSNFQMSERGSKEADLMAGFQDLKGTIRNLEGA